MSLGWMTKCFSPWKRYDQIKRSNFSGKNQTKNLSSIFSVCPATWHSLTVCRAALFHSIWPIRKGKVKIVRFQLKWTFKWKFSDTCYIPPPQSNIKATGGEKKDKSRHKCKYTLFLSIFSFSSFTLYIEQFFHLNSFLRKKTSLYVHIFTWEKKRSYHYVSYTYKHMLQWPEFNLSPSNNVKYKCISKM